LIWLKVDRVSTRFETSSSAGPVGAAGDDGFSNAPTKSVQIVRRSGVDVDTLGLARSRTGRLRGHGLPWEPSRAGLLNGQAVLP